MEKRTGIPKPPFLMIAPKGAPIINMTIQAIAWVYFWYQAISHLLASLSIPSSLVKLVEKLFFKVLAVLSATDAALDWKLLSFVTESNRSSCPSLNTTSSLGNTSFFGVTGVFFRLFTIFSRTVSRSTSAILSLTAVSGPVEANGDSGIPMGSAFSPATESIDGDGRGSTLTGLSVERTSF